MNRLDSQTRAQVINCLIEGCSIRSTVRMTGVAKKTVMRLLVEVGAVCSAYQDRVCRDLSCRRIQVDEQWRFATPRPRTSPRRSPPRIHTLAMYGCGLLSMPIVSWFPAGCSALAAM